MNITAPSIFDCSSFSEFFRAYIAWRRQCNSRYSYALLARQLGGISVSLVGQLAAGNRHASPKVILRLSRLLAWSPQEYEFATHLASLAKTSGERERSIISETLKRLKPTSSVQINKLSKPDFFADWVQVAILSLAGIRGFQLNQKYLQEHLFETIPPIRLKKAVENIVKRKLLTKGADGKFRPFKGENMESPIHTPIKSVRRFHKQMMDCAKHAIDLQPIDKRFFCGTSLTVSKAKIPEAQKFLDETRRKFIENFAENSGDAVYHLGIQFFSLTKLD